ncbi:hypothetical protein SAMN05518672_10448 [Chitinophaga sp. CF118]|uniref:hypothetical protein n=1 Tax=Chitinophaga sp. CF118 TaxID=1884367 RepID=UPI0008E1BC76|nr:hypothetical protein [Chitinophaga sp. CF118]SFD98724.1 hypothetical protein SAMN05518672_10448 [Chitinophaga sp. CF118]
MKIKSVLIFLSLLCAPMYVSAQYYPDVLTYTMNGVPANGIKIKTNLAFINGAQMPTIMIEGFSHGSNEPISLILNYYVYTNVFYKGKISSSGSYTPPVYLAVENGMVVIFIDSQSSYQRIHVRAFGWGRVGDVPASYTGWTAVDSALSVDATATYLLPYQNRFSGDVYLPGNSVFNTDGNLGIGTTAPGTNKLAVEGTIGARKMQVKQTSWADFVFQPDYQLPPLQELEKYIQANKHLPGIPTETEVQEKGIDLGEMNKLLLQKVEELTLHVIDLQKQINQLHSQQK